MEKVWVVGRFVAETEHGNVWDMQGVFETEDEAVAACRDATYWIGPVPLGQSLPHESAAWPEARYPLA